MKRWVRGMRDAFFEALYKIAKKDKNVILLTADIGAFCLDNFKHKLREQFFNAGVAEQNMIGLAAGLAMTGKKVYVYGMPNFITMRCYEQVRNDLCGMKLPVTIVTVGAGLDYSALGLTHHAIDDVALLNTLPGMQIYNPSDNVMAAALAKLTYEQKQLKCVRLDRTGTPLIYKKERDIDLSAGANFIREGKDLYIISSGRMVSSALRIAQILSTHSIETGVIDLFRIKPFNGQALWRKVKNVRYLVTLEEHFLDGGIGSIVSKWITTKNCFAQLLPIGITKGFFKGYGSRAYLQRYYGIDADSVARKTMQWLASRKRRNNRR